MLAIVSEAILTLKPDALVGSDKDAEAEVIAANDFGQSGVLGIAQTDAAELRWDLKAKGSEFTQSLS